MKYQIRESDDQGFYYALEIDSGGNEKVLGQNTDLNQLRKDHNIPDDIEPILESLTRATKQPPKQD